MDMSGQVVLACGAVVAMVGISAASLPLATSSLPLVVTKLSPNTVICQWRSKSTPLGNPCSREPSAPEHGLSLQLIVGVTGGVGFLFED